MVIVLSDGEQEEIDKKADNGLSFSINEEFGQEVDNGNNSSINEGEGRHEE